MSSENIIETKNGFELKKALRDPISGAVVVNDQESYEHARKRKKLAQERKEAQSTIDSLETRLDQLESRVRKLIEKGNDNA